jgi:hypothetical protein
MEPPTQDDPISISRTPQPVQAGSQQAKPADDKRFAITARLRHALDLMIWGDVDGRVPSWDEAGRAMNISARSMRKSLERPVVRAYLREQKQVFRATISAKSLWRLDELAAQRTNMNAAVAAIKVIEDGDVASIGNNNNSPPAVVINILSGQVAAAPDYVVSASVKPAAFDLQPVIKPAAPTPGRDRQGRLDERGEPCFDPRFDD